jgi:[ribosomal protein S18]-alanine N-acetyltransferase
MWLPGIRLARGADALAIADMSREYIEHGLGWSWTTARVAAAIQDEATNVAVVHLSGDLIAFGIMHYGDRTAHLALLAVHPMQRKRGIATRLLSWLEKCADTAGIERIRVEARSDSPAAIAFYRRQGYAPTDRLANYYRGVLDALRFEKTLRAPIRESRL